jgi:RHS repeat-associated protein
MNTSATQSIAQKRSGTRTDFAYETDSDLDWMRDRFAGGATATAPNATWMGIDYGYDKSSRLTQMSATDSAIVGAMPVAGTNGTANNINQVASVAGRASLLTWSMAGNMESDGKGTSFTHDGLQHLTKATRTGLIMHYAYNSAGLRIESIKNPQTALDARDMPVGGDRTRYVLSGAEEVADLDGERNVIRRYIPGAAIDERVAQIETNGAISFMHNDKQNSVIAISDSAGNPVVRRGYGTYGETDPAQMVGTTTAGSSAHPFGYTGRRWDPDLGLYYYRARWYDPQLGTFLQTDPIGSLDYINLYAYVGLEPGNGADPSGETGIVTVDGRNNVHIRLEILFEGPGLTAERQSDFISRTETSWSGIFGKYTVSTTVVPTSTLTPSGNRVEFNASGFPTGPNGGHSYVESGFNMHLAIPDMATPKGEIAGTVADNLDVVVHEVGHLFGLSDTYNLPASSRDALMEGNVMDKGPISGIINERDITSIINSSNNDVTHCSAGQSSSAEGCR